MIEVNLNVTETCLTELGFREVSFQDPSCMFPFLNPSAVFYLLMKTEMSTGYINYSRTRQRIIRDRTSSDAYPTAIYVGLTPDDSSLDSPRLIISVHNQCYSCRIFSEATIRSAILYLRDEYDFYPSPDAWLTSLGFEPYDTKE